VRTQLLSWSKHKDFDKKEKEDFVEKGIYENGRFGDIKLAKDKNLFLQQPEGNLIEEI